MPLKCRCILRTEKRNTVLSVRKLTLHCKLDLVPSENCHSIWVQPSAAEIFVGNSLIFGCNMESMLDRAETFEGMTALMAPFVNE